MQMKDVHAAAGNLKYGVTVRHRAAGQHWMIPYGVQPAWICGNIPSFELIWSCQDAMIEVLCRLWLLLICCLTHHIPLMCLRSCFTAEGVLQCQPRMRNPDRRIAKLVELFSVQCSRSKSSVSLLRSVTAGGSRCRQLSDFHAPFVTLDFTNFNTPANKSGNVLGRIPLRIFLRGMCSHLAVALRTDCVHWVEETSKHVQSTNQQPDRHMNELWMCVPNNQSLAHCLSGKLLFLCFSSKRF